ncbi:MAG: hypothetical protein ACOC85_00920 [Thermoplasmatota archaeon]
MAILTSYQAAVGGVCVILIYGIVMEKHYVSKSTVFYNILSFILLLASIDIPDLLIIGMILYLVLGVIVIKKHLKFLFPAFGARTYGSLALVLILQGNRIIPGLEGRELMETFLLLLAMWLGVAVLVYIVGYTYKKYW